MKTPDETLRERLRGLAEHEPLRSLSANERVLAEQAAEASLRLREGKGRGWAVMACSFSLLLAGVVCWQVFDEAQPSIAKTVDPVVPTPRCQAFSGRTVEGAQLAGRATFSAAPASEVTIALSADCDVSANLSVGSLYVHAANLEGRALRVLTPHGHVEVRGTVFAVHSDEERLSVEVDEGHVEVFAADGRSVSLRAGQAVRIEARSVQRAPAQLPARNVLRAAIGQKPRAKVEEPVPPTPAVTESVWRTGSVPTPSMSPEPKTSLTEDGRPMRKPHVTSGE